MKTASKVSGRKIATTFGDLPNWKMILLINSALHRFTICLAAEITITIHLNSILPYRLKQIKNHFQIWHSIDSFFSYKFTYLAGLDSIHTFYCFLHVCCDTVSYQCHCSVQDYRLYEALLQFNSRCGGHSMLSSGKMENMNRNMHITLWLERLLKIRL